MSYTATQNDQTLNDSKSYSTQPSIIASLKNTKPYVPAYDENGNLAFARDYPNAGSEDTPLYMAKMYDILGTSTRFLGGLSLNYEIVKGLNFKVHVGLDNPHLRNYTYFPIDSRVARGSKGQASQEDQTIINLLNENTIEYKKTVDKHQFSILGGFTYQTENNRDLMASAQGFPSDYYSYHNLGLATNPLPPSSSTTSWTLISYLGRLNYMFNDKYMLTATVRYDGSSKFGENNKYGLFPSAAIAWKLSEEDFIKNLNVFSLLKLRAGMGQTGNESIGLYQSIPLIATYNDLNTGYVLNNQQVPVAFPNNIGNPDLTWEKGSDFNIGLDVGILHDRVQLNLDVYDKKTTDLLLNLPIPVQNGFASVLTNAGGIENKGVEIGLNTINLNGKFG